MAMTLSQAAAALRGNQKIKDAIDAVLQAEVAETVKQTEQQAAIDTVYSVYRPVIYERRGQYEGLGDPENMEVTLAEPGRLEVQNITDPNDNYDGTVNKFLPELVEYGNYYKRYTYDYPKRNAAFMKPRPFTERTAHMLRSGGDHIKAMKKGLKSRGWKVV